MLSHFDQELEKLNKHIIKMGNLTMSQISNANKILLGVEHEQQEILIMHEHKIDKLDVKVDKLCQRIFALQQPIATDLRFIMGSLRIGNELERIGDMAMSIINKSEAIREQPEILNRFSLEEIADISELLLKKVLECYVFRDNLMVTEIKEVAKKMQESAHTMLENVIIEMTKKSEVIVMATNLILILYQYERIAKHAENIAESINFIVLGEIIKHPGKRKTENL